MKKEHIFESAAETAKKIRGKLKEAFAGIKFSVTSSTYSMGSNVSVSWIDGPIQKDVDEILNGFKSGSFDGMSDLYTSSGYEWEGKIVTGAKFIHSRREWSAERKGIIEAELPKYFEPDAMGYFNYSDWTHVELQLITCGILKGCTSRLELPVLSEPVGEVEVKPKRGNVIAFPIRKAQ